MSLRDDIMEMLAREGGMSIKTLSEKLAGRPTKKGVWLAIDKLAESNLIERYEHDLSTPQGVLRTTTRRSEARWRLRE